MSVLFLFLLYVLNIVTFKTHELLATEISGPRNYELLFDLLRIFYFNILAFNEVIHVGFKKLEGSCVPLTKSVTQNSSNTMYYMFLYVGFRLSIVFFHH